MAGSEVATTAEAQPVLSDGLAINENITIKNNSHLLSDKWTLWAHLPHDIDWSVESYKKIDTFDTVEGVVTLCEILPEKMIKNCMLFIMRDGIQPTWEDPKNSTGGCFSYKVNNKVVESAWTNLLYSLVGETLSANNNLMKTVNGITISPKKNFCIVKIWFSGCDFQDPLELIEINGLSSHGCLFKKHLPSY